MSSPVIHQPITRIDGTLKVTGAAPYGSEHVLQNLAYGVPVTSTIGSGQVTAIDSSVAEHMPGVLGIIHHGNVEPMFRPAQGFEKMVRAGETRPPFEDNHVFYYGQYLALVIAETFEQAQAAAAKVRISYQPDTLAIDLEHMPAPSTPPSSEYSRGDADAALAGAAVKVDETYMTPVETHNPMEMHATIASWNKENDHLTLYETTQGVVNHHNTVCQMLDLPLASVHVISPFVGAGYGSKLFPWPQSLMAAAASRHVGRPVKVTVPRTLMFTTVGHRPFTEQRVRLGATQDGKLVSIHHDVRQETSMVDDYVERCTDPTPMLYSCPNVSAIQHLVKLNVGTPTPMRGPGTTPGLFAIESALDELAVKLNMDPLELRLRNYAEKDEGTNHPFSSKHLRECYEQGAARFGWSKRTPQVGSMRRGNLILGWGMGTCTWPCNRNSADVRVRLLADGGAYVSCATQDIGTGTYTIFAQVVSDKTGIPVEKIRVVLGDSELTPGPTSGGSAATATVLPAIGKAAEQAQELLFNIAAKTEKSPFQNADPKSLKMAAGRVYSQDKSLENSVPFEQILALKRLSAVDGQAKTDAEEAAKQYSIHSFGAHFCEIEFDPEIARLRVSRWVTVIDGGRIINTKTGHSQIVGGIVMGIGMGLFEETVYDSRNGHPVNSNYADYLVPTNYDIPEIDCTLLDYPDPIINQYGARGIGEIGLTGVASALASATYHATGVRVRKLPIRIEALLQAESPVAKV
ncbi:MAG: xanthine dehydrogenase family protein molybdopterin-binding subunit [Candidatus Korobacteraceae bacterium]